MRRGPYKATPPPGTFADLIQKFRNSPRYKGWAPLTREINDRILEQFRQANGRAMVSDLRRGDVIAMRDEMADKPGAARNWLKVVRVLLDYAVDLEMVPMNVAKTVKRLKPAHAQGYRTWREDEIAAYLDCHKLGTMPHLAMVLMLYTGASKADVVKLGPSNIMGDRLRYRRQKTSRTEDVVVDVPILPPLAEALALASSRMTFLETAQGRARSSKSLTGSMAVWVRMAGLGEADELGRYLSPHGLRKAQGRRLAEAGCSPHEIMAWLGHSDLKQAMTYSKAYDRARATDSAAEKMGAAKAEEPKVVRLKGSDNS